MRSVTHFICLQALGIAIKLTLKGDNQLVYAETHFCLGVSLPSVMACLFSQSTGRNMVYDVFVSWPYHTAWTG